MARQQKEPLRGLAADEYQFLERVSRSGSAPASHVARAKALLAVSRGHSYAEAARLAGRRSGDAVSMLVSRFNGEGIGAIEPRHGGGPPVVYKEAERERILREALGMHIRPLLPGAVSVKLGAFVLVSDSTLWVDQAPVHITQFGVVCPLISNGDFHGKRPTSAV